MPKRNVAFSKPSEPSFIRKIKEQIGYKEGPTVDTKRETLDRPTREDFADTEEEQPTVVVLNPGDLSAEEANQVKKQIEKEAEEAPADLNAPIVFKARTNKKQPASDSTEVPIKEKQSISDTTEVSKKRTHSSKDSKSSKKVKTKAVLSFDDEEEEEN